MRNATRKQISESRKLLGNPYAYEDGNGNYDAIITSPPNRELISQSRRLYQDPYAHLDGEGNYDALPSNIAQRPTPAFQLDIESIWGNSLRQRNKQNQIRYSHSDIEMIARDFQKQLWKHQDQIWDGKIPTDLVDILSPDAALRVIGYQHHLRDSLGQYSIHGKRVEVAGLINTSTKEVEISKLFKNEIRRFTTAHELGHALLHNANGLHRDRPLDGSTSAETPDPIETEANKFATYFLMPGRLVKARFKSIFRTEKFHLDEGTLFALFPGEALDIRRTINLRDLAIKLATAERYDDKRFISLANQFQVSPLAMAIRLEELELLTV